jgi:hypothetical protein
MMRLKDGLTAEEIGIRMKVIFICAFPKLHRKIGSLARKLNVFVDMKSHIIVMSPMRKGIKFSLSVVVV